MDGIAWDRDSSRFMNKKNQASIYLPSATFPLWFHSQCTQFCWVYLEDIRAFLDPPLMQVCMPIAWDENQLSREIISVPFFFQSNSEHNYLILVQKHTELTAALMEPRVWFICRAETCWGHGRPRGYSSRWPTSPTSPREPLPGEVNRPSIHEHSADADKHGLEWAK